MSIYLKNYNINNDRINLPLSTDSRVTKVRHSPKIPRTFKTPNYNINNDGVNLLLSIGSKLRKVRHSPKVSTTFKAPNSIHIYIVNILFEI